MKHILVVIALSLAACATHSESAGFFHEDSTAHEVLDTKSDEKATSHEEAKEHAEDRGTENTDEAIAETRTGGAVELDVVTTKPDGTKTEKHFRRAPIEVHRDSKKNAAMQKAMTDDASRIFGAEDVKHDETAKKADTDTKKNAAKTTEHDAKAQLFSLAGGGLLLLVVLAGAAFFLWRKFKSTKLGKLAEAAADVVSPIP